MYSKVENVIGFDTTQFSHGKKPKKVLYCWSSMQKNING